MMRKPIPNLPKPFPNLYTPPRHFTHFLKFAPLGDLRPPSWENLRETNIMWCGALSPWVLPSQPSTSPFRYVPHPPTQSTSSIHVKTLSGAPPSLGSSHLLGVWHLDLIQEGSLCLSKYKWRPSHPHFFTISWAIVMLPNSCLIPLSSSILLSLTLALFWRGTCSN